MPCERRPIPKNRGGARSDRADSSRHPGENALLSSQRGRAGSVLDMWRPLNEAHLKNVKVAFAKKKKNSMKSQKVTFQISQKLLTENLRERPSIQNMQ